MKNIKQNLNTYFNGIVSIMILVVTGFYIANVNQPYYKDMNATLLTILVVTLLISLVPFVLKKINQVSTRNLVASLEKIILPMLIIYSGVQFLAMRVESFGYIFASNLEAGNEDATRAGTQAILLLVLFVLAWLLSIISSFMSGDE
ncbi:TPA: hypothetical protein ACGOON_001683 [Streptococcus suis]